MKSVRQTSLTKEQYQLLTKLAPVIIYSIAMDGQFTFLSPAFETITGWKVKDWVGKPFISIIHPDDVNLAVDKFKQGLNGCITEPFELRIKTPFNDYLIGEFHSISQIKDDKVIGKVGIARDITVYKQLERRKDEFISTASHELKTPLATLKGYTQIMKNSPALEKHSYYLDKMDTQIDRLCQLVEDLLDVAKIQSNKLSLQKSRFNISKLVSEIAEDFLRVSGGHLIKVTNGINQTVSADRYRLSDVLNNLLSNAVKFSPKSGEILVTLEKQDQSVVISVQDFGIGISKKNLDRVFEPFFQANNKIRQSFSGLGLGLHISAEIIKRHGGKIWVESEKGKGTTFSFSLPVES